MGGGEFKRGKGHGPQETETECGKGRKGHTVDVKRGRPRGKETSTTKGAWGGGEGTKEGTSST